MICLEPPWTNDPDEPNRYKLLLIWRGMVQLGILQSFSVKCFLKRPIIRNQAGASSHGDANLL